MNQTQDNQEPMDNGQAAPASGDPGHGDTGRLLPSAREVWRNLSALLLWSLALVGVLLAQMRWWERRTTSQPITDGFPADAPPAPTWTDWALYLPPAAMLVFYVLFMAIMGRWVNEPLVRGRIRFWGTVLTVLALIYSVMMTLMYQMGSQRAF